MMLSDLDIWLLRKSFTYYLQLFDAVCVMLSSDKSIPQLDATMTDYQTEINELSSLVTSQIEFEQASHESRAKNAPHASPCTEPRYDACLFSTQSNYLH